MRSIHKVTLLLVGLLLVAGSYKLREMPIGKAYAAQQICSGVFVSQIDESILMSQFIAPNFKRASFIWKITIDRANRRVTVGDKLFGNLFSVTALFRDRIGCTLLTEQSSNSANQLTQRIVQPIDEAPLPAGAWPYADGSQVTPLPADINEASLNAAVKNAFLENKKGVRNTTALLVVYKNQLIAEKYSPGITPDTPLLGWSMTKSIVGLLMGLLQDSQQLDVRNPAPVPEWKNTPKQMITIDQLLHMSSGLKFNEGYEKLSDVSEMLFRKANMADYALKKALRASPGTEFNYSSGSTVILSSIIGHCVGNTPQATYTFYKQKLFNQLDIRSAFIALDATDTMVGSSYGYMTARDWARLGLFFLRKGEWKNQQVLSKQWMEYMLTPAVTHEQYGAQLWLNTDAIDYPTLPASMYYLAGFNGQRIFILPEQDLVVIRMGVTPDESNIGEVEILSQIMSALPSSK